MDCCGSAVLCCFGVSDIGDREDCIRKKVGIKSIDDYLLTYEFIKSGVVE